jgi:hypothetical protein
MRKKQNIISLLSPLSFLLSPLSSLIRFLKNPSTPTNLTLGDRTYSELS